MNKVCQMLFDVKLEQKYKHICLATMTLGWKHVEKKEFLNHNLGYNCRMDIIFIFKANPMPFTE